MKVKLLIVLAILFSYGTAEIKHYSGSMARNMSIDLDSNKIVFASTNDDMSEFEFGLYGHGLLWMKPDGRTYTFFRNSYLVNDPLDNVDVVFNITDTTLFTDSTEWFSMFRLPNDGYIGGDSTGLVWGTQQYPVEQDVDTSQYFLIKTNQSNYCLFRFSESKTFFNYPFLEFDLDSITFDYWVQDDGSLNFINFKEFTPITLNTTLNTPKPKIIVNGNLIDCSMIPGIKDIAIYSLSGKMVLKKTDTNFEKVSVSQLPSGQYYLKVATEEKKLVYKLMLK